MAQRWWTFAVISSLGLWAISAQAQSECAADADCDFGFTCQVIGSSGACPAIACVDGQDCPAVDCGPVEELKACEPLRDCQGDAQCAEGFVCHEETYETCMTAGVKCDPNGTCVEQGTSGCESITETYCAPRWILPCTADADCGTGFSCVEQQMCWCSGSAGTADVSGVATTTDVDGGASSSGGGSDVMAPIDAGVIVTEPDCGCAPSGDFSCELQDTTCESDADCQSGLTCQDDPSSSVCTNVAPVMTTSGGTAMGGSSGTSAPQDAGVAIGDTTTTDPTLGGCTPTVKRCAPPDYFTGGFGFPRGGVAAGEILAADTGSSGDSKTGVSDTTGTDQAPTMSGQESTNAGSPGHNSIGCSVSHARLGFGQLAFVALALLNLRRRKK